MPSLPDPRTLLTNIFSPLPPRSNAEIPYLYQAQPSTAQTTSGNLPQSLKPALLTLHVLYPNELLPALDLLDRNLVTRFVVQELDREPVPSNANPIGHQHDQNVTSSHSPLPSSSSSPSPQTQPQKITQKRTPLYYIRSSQQSRQHFSSRHGPPSDIPVQHYEVRPLAWNCSCPAFAFSAFPALISTPISPSRVHPQPNTDSSPILKTHAWDTEMLTDDGNESDEWEFGGLSKAAEGGVPMCKHLLACIIVERWGEFGSEGVEEKSVSVEELAGWGAGWGG